MTIVDFWQKSTELRFENHARDIFSFNLQGFTLQIWYILVFMGRYLAYTPKSKMNEKIIIYNQLRLELVLKKFAFVAV